MPIRRSLDITHVHVLSSCLRVQDTARDLGVVIDSQLSLSAHIAAVCRSGYYQLCRLQLALQSLSEDASKTLRHHFLKTSFPVAWTTATLCFSASRKDWSTDCSSECQPPSVIGTRRSDHLTTLASGILARQGATLVDQLLSGISPSYVADDCHFVADARERRATTTFHNTKEIFVWMVGPYGTVWNI